MDSWKNKLKLRIPVILLLAATLLFWGIYDQYRSIGPALLKAPVLDDASMISGDISESNGVFTLRVPDTGKRAFLHFELDAATQFSIIRVNASIRTDDVIARKHTWNSARLLLIQRDNKGKWIFSKHSLFPKQGTVPWTKQVQEFNIDPIAFSVELVIQQSGKSGTAQFKDVVVQPLEIKDSFTSFRVLFAIAWVFMALLYFSRCRLNHRRLRIPIMLNTIAILFGILMPGDWIGNISEQLKEKVSESLSHPAPSHPTPSKDKNNVNQAVSKKSPDIGAAETWWIGQFNSVVGTAQKLGHFVLFATLCFLVYCSAWLEKQHPVYYFKVGLDILLFAAVTESLQYLTIDRTPNILDWIIDIYGLLTALIFFLLIRFIARFIPTYRKTQ